MKRKETASADNYSGSPRSTIFIPVVRHFSDRRSRAVLCGRLLFIACLCAAAAAVGVISYHFLTESETDLAETQFESIADRALTEAYGSSRRKRLGALTMASVVSEMYPNAEDWPFVAIDGFERIVNNILKSSSGSDMAYIPLVTPEELPEWEDFAYYYYYNKRSPPHPNGTATSSFGRGVWGLDPNWSSVDNRYHAQDGSTPWGSPIKILTPIFQVNEGINPALMLNIRTDPVRGKPIDDLIECSRRPAEAGELEDFKCGVITGMAQLPKSPPSRGPGAIIFQPIYPANNKTTLVGLLPTAVVWDEILDNIFSTEVNGIDCVLSTEKQVSTYTAVDGVALSR